MENRPTRHTLVQSLSEMESKPWSSYFQWPVTTSRRTRIWLLWSVWQASPIFIGWVTRSNFCKRSQNTRLSWKMAAHPATIAPWLNLQPLPLPVVMDWPERIWCHHPQLRRPSKCDLGWPFMASSSHQKPPGIYSHSSTAISPVWIRFDHEIWLSYRKIDSFMKSQGCDWLRKERCGNDY